MRSSVISNIFLLAGAYNIVCVLVFSKFFTNTLLSSLYPTVFSSFNLICILLWGVAYSSVATSYRSVPYLLLVFTAAKTIYFITWIVWHYRHGSGVRLLTVTSDCDMLRYLRTRRCRLRDFLSVVGAKRAAQITGALRSRKTLHTLAI